MPGVFEMLHERLELWEQDYIERNRIEGAPALDCYVLSGERRRGAVLVFPGGGYHFLSDREAESVALQFAAAGYHAFVLRYSVAPNRHPQPLRDAARAVCLVRERAAEWKVAADRIAVCGFSAGGHLAACLGVHWDKREWLSAPGIDIGLNRPDAMILCYPVITSNEFAHRSSFLNLLGEDPEAGLLDAMSLEKHVHARATPAAFLWHTVADGLVPVENSLLFAQSLRAGGIPFEMHIFPDGPHGLSLATAETATEHVGTDAHVAAWLPLCVGWLDHAFGGGNTR